MENAVIKCIAQCQVLYAAIDLLCAIMTSYQINYFLGLFQEISETNNNMVEEPSTVSLLSVKTQNNDNNYNHIAENKNMLISDQFECGDCVSTRDSRSDSFIKRRSRRLCILGWICVSFAVLFAIAAIILVINITGE